MQKWQKFCIVVGFLVVLGSAYTIREIWQAPNPQAARGSRGSGPWHSLGRMDDMVDDIQLWNLGGAYTLKFTSHNPGDFKGDYYTYRYFSLEERDPYVTFPPAGQILLVRELVEKQNPDLASRVFNEEGRFPQCRPLMMRDGPVENSHSLSCQDERAR